MWAQPIEAFLHLIPAAADNVIMALDAKTGIVHWVYGTSSEIATIPVQ
jgi:glucose dehydrogenase